VTRAIVAGHADAVLARAEAHSSLEPYAKALREDVALVRHDPAAPAVVAGARELALRLAHTLTAALLYEHAPWGTELEADLWTRRRLSHEDVAADAAHHFSSLVQS